jgi:chromatin structure-remodeling complex subunit RSC1/2
VVVPTPQPIPTPVASTSAAKPKPVAIRPKTTKLTVENEEETMTPEPDILGDTNLAVERNEENEEIVRQLEKGLPRWPGFGEEGWSDGISQVRSYFTYLQKTLSTGAGTHH